MSRKLVSRARMNEQTTPQRRQAEDLEDHDSAPLPQYDAPVCPLTASSRRALEQLHKNHDYTLYRKHLKQAMVYVHTTAGENLDRVHFRKENVKKLEGKLEKKRTEGTEGDEEEKQLKEELEQDRAFLKTFEKKTDVHLESAEAAMRDLIDYEDELAYAAGGPLMEGVCTTINNTQTPVPAPQSRRPTRRRRAEDMDDDDDEEPLEEGEPAIPTVPIPSAVELLKKATNDYKTSWYSKSMLDRYGDHNEYKTFKSTVHDAQNPQEGAPPLSKPSQWFPQDKANSASQSNRRSRNRTDNANNEDESDDDLIISGATANLYCPLTLLQFSEPYTNSVCKHTFQKQAVLEYINSNGTIFRRGVGQEKQVNCPCAGCDNMLKSSDFYDDGTILRQVKRAQRQAARDADEDDDDDEIVPGTQRSRPENIDDYEDDDDDDEDIQNHQGKSLAQIKRERQSRGLSMARGDENAVNNVDRMDEDE